MRGGFARCPRKVERRERRADDHPHEDHGPPPSSATTTGFEISSNESGIVHPA